MLNCCKIPITLRRKSRITHLEAIGLTNALSIPMGGPKAHENSRPLNESYTRGYNVTTATPTLRVRPNGNRCI